MSAINADTIDFWKQLAADLSAQRPSPGRHIRVTASRKHKGKEGTVVRHEASRYDRAFRYGGEANLHMREMAGRSGFRVLVQHSTTPEKFWIDADKVDVIERLTYPETA